MKRTFDLGMSAVQVDGFRRRLTITVQFGGQSFRKEDEGYFSISGQIGGGNRWIEFGRCQKHIREICHEKWHKLLDELLDLDKKYALMYCKCIPEEDAKRIKKIIKEGL